jgi:TonB family protein
VFEGTFIAGELNGEGHFHLRNGADYVGELRNARPHGRGIFVYADGTRYEGEFRFGLREGRGSWIASTGRKLEGNWLANELDGQGVEVLPGGERREGGFKAGLLSGTVKVSMPDGRTFEGEFDHGVRHGPGVETGWDGVRTEGRWVNGVLDRNVAQSTRSGERLEQSPTIGSMATCAPTRDDYPVDSRRLNEQGTTRMRFSVDASGKVVQADLARSSGYPRLDEVALNKLSACTFKAGMFAEGRQFSGPMEVDFVWRLD